MGGITIYISAEHGQEQTIMGAGEQGGFLQEIALNLLGRAPAAAGVGKQRSTKSGWYQVWEHDWQDIPAG